MHTWTQGLDIQILSGPVDQIHLALSLALQKIHSLATEKLSLPQNVTKPFYVIDQTQLSKHPLLPKYTWEQRQTSHFYISPDHLLATWARCNNSLNNLGIIICTQIVPAKCANFGPLLLQPCPWDLRLQISCGVTQTPMSVKLVTQTMVQNKVKG